MTETTDGKPFRYWGGKVFLDEVHYYNFDEDNQLTAFASGDVHTIYEFSASSSTSWPRNWTAWVLEARTAQNLCCRMQVDQKPFDDLRVRKAFQIACDNTAVPELVFMGGGDVGEDHHVAPVHPEYAKLPMKKRDPEAGQEAAGRGRPSGRQSR